MTSPNHFFDGLVGHREVKDLLLGLLSSGRVPHGLLLFGDAGRGKRSLALAFAKAAVAHGDPDGARIHGPLVRSLDALTHPHISVVEALEEQRFVTIDQVRTLKAAFSLARAEARRRVAVVVDADRLTEEAGNALLKILEEPPAQSHLVLTARDLGSVMGTIVSRCVPVRVPPLSDQEILAVLNQQGVPGETARWIASLAEGRPGFALEMASTEFEERVFGPARQLVSPGGRPFGVAESVVAGCRQGTKKTEGLRENLRLVLEAAAWLLRQDLRRECGATAGESLSTGPIFALEEQLERILLARRDLDRNVSPELVIESLLAR